MNDETLLRLAREASTYVGLSSVRDLDIGLLETGAIGKEEAAEIRRRLREEDPVAADELLGPEPEWVLVRQAREWWLVAKDSLHNAAALIASGSALVRRFVKGEVAFLSGNLRVSWQNRDERRAVFAHGDFGELPFHGSAAQDRIKILCWLAPDADNRLELGYVIRFEQTEFKSVSVKAIYAGDEWGPKSVKSGESRSWVLPGGAHGDPEDKAISLVVSWMEAPSGARGSASLVLVSSQI